VSRGGAGARIALILGSLAAGVLGWFLVSTFGPSDEASSAPGAIDLYSCPIDGAQSIGQLQPDADVWLIGQSAGRWGVIRHPDDPDRLAWVPLAQVSTAANQGDLPEMGCDENPVTGTTAPPTSAPDSTAVGASSTSSTSTSSTSSTSSTTSTTIPSDRTPPTVTLAANPPERTYLYTSPAPGCPFEASLEVAVSVADPTLPVSIRSIIANWNSPAGPQSANLTPVAGNRFQLVITANGPVSGELPVTITATAADGAGNVGAGTLTVQLRNPASFGCA
jgi:hypothetical protein